MKCVKCKKSFIHPDKYITHLEILHNARNSFICPEKNCQRSFHRKYVFKKHLYLKHFVNKTVHKNLAKIACLDKPKQSNIDKEKYENFQLIESSCSSRNTDKDCFKEMSAIFSLFKERLSSAIKKLISIFYAKLNIQKSVIQDIIDNICSFLDCGIIENIIEAWNLILKKYDIEKTLSDIISKMLELLKYPFSSVQTEHKREKFFESCNYLIKPVEYKIGSSEEVTRKNNVSLVLKDRLGCFIPLDLTLKNFLELPDVINKIINYQTNLLKYNSLDTGCMFHLLNGTMFKNSFNMEENLILPLILYFDDFETGNALGSHAGVFKLGVVYFSIATIPPEFSSKLENIFLALLFHSSDREQFGNGSVFNKLIEALNNLENIGIEVNAGCNKKKIFFKTTLILGDNLGLHAILGCVESFSALYYCRFCLGTKLENQSQTCEMNDRMRQKEDYEIHLNKRLGLKEPCVWHNLNNFHIYENVSCDVMHDLFEGVHRYSMAHIIHHFVSNKIVSLQIINTRIKYFKYFYDEKNKPPPIKLSQLNNKFIILSASEMLCLVNNFRFIIGDLIPAENEIWNFYLILLEITNILTSSSISHSTIDLLRVLISEHHTQYLTLFKDNLKPKHHILTHYPNIILKIGPSILLSSMRFEAKHRDFKSNILRCRINVPYTLSHRHQLKFCYRLMSSKGFANETKIGSETDETIHLNGYRSVAFIEINSIRYQVNFILVFEIADNIPIFCEINQVLVDENNKCKFLCRFLRTKSYSLHYQAYSVEYDFEFKIITLEELYSEVPSTLYTLTDDQMYVSKQY